MTQAATREFTRQAWRLVHLQGMTQRQAADQLGITQSTVSRQLKGLEAGLAKEFRVEVEAHRARQVLYLEHLFQQALQAWEQSCQDQLKVRTTSGRTLRGRGGEPVPLPDLVVTTTLPGTGNPRYLTLACRVLADLRRLRGLDAAPQPAAAPASPHSPSDAAVTHPGRIIYEIVSPDEVLNDDASAWLVDAQPPSLDAAPCSLDAASCGADADPWGVDAAEGGVDAAACPSAAASCGRDAPASRVDAAACRVDAPPPFPGAAPSRAAALSAAPSMMQPAPSSDALVPALSPDPHPDSPDLARPRPLTLPRPRSAPDQPKVESRSSLKDPLPGTEEWAQLPPHLRRDPNDPIAYLPPLPRR